jgi:AmmeMemoRadiSam system protein A
MKESRDRSSNPGGSAPERPREERDTLVRVARESIRHGVETGSALEVDPAEYPEALRVEAATFVTLEIDDALRGCIGVYEARRPLVEDVAQNAFAAGFRDPRFQPLSREELEELEIHISILSEPVPLEVEDEDHLLRELRPGTDGLILEDPPFRALFLPQVWESLSDPADFLLHLRMKAGLSPDHFTDTIRFWRFTVEDIR